MSADRPQADDRIAAIATNYASTGEHAKTPLMICVGSGRTSLQGKIQLTDLDGKVIHGDFELPVSTTNSLEPSSRRSPTRSATSSLAKARDFRADA